MSLLCLLGLHSRTPDPDVPTVYGLYAARIEAMCRRCDGRWICVVGRIGPIGSDTKWTRIR